MVRFHKAIVPAALTRLFLKITRKQSFLDHLMLFSHNLPPLNRLQKEVNNVHPLALSI